MNKKILPVILILAVLLVAGCTQGSNKTPPPKTTEAPKSTPVQPAPQTTGATEPTAAPKAAELAPKSFSLEITHGGYSFKDADGKSVTELKVSKGAKVMIEATSTPASHKHGVSIDAYKINTEVKAEPGSTPQEITFMADKTGTFEIYCKTCLDGAQGAHPQLKSSLVVE